MNITYDSVEKEITHADGTKERFYNGSIYLDEVATALSAYKHGGISLQDAWVELKFPSAHFTPTQEELDRCTSTLSDRIDSTPLPDKYTRMA